MKIGNSEIRVKRVDWPSPIAFILVFTLLIFNLQTSAITDHSTLQDTLHTVPDTPELTVSQVINNTFTPVVDVMTDILFWDPFAWSGVYDDKGYDEQGEPDG